MCSINCFIQGFQLDFKYFSTASAPIYVFRSPLSDVHRAEIVHNIEVFTHYHTNGLKHCSSGNIVGKVNNCL